MGKVNVYLPDDLEQAVRDAGISISPVCQMALRDALDRLAAVRIGGVPESATPRLVEVLDLARERAADDGRQVTVHGLLGAIVQHGANLGARVLRSMGVELPAGGARGRTPKGDGELATETREVLAVAQRLALELRHRHVGTEHVVLAMAEASSPVAHLFDALGIEPRSLRQQVERLVADPWSDVTAEPVPLTDRGAYARLDAEVQRLALELDRVKRELGGA